MVRAQRARRQQQRRGTVQTGDTGSAVKALQQRLSDLGYAVSTDGQFGPETEAALREFQQSRGAKVDGVVGRETLGKLLRSNKAKPNPADVGIDAISKVVGTGQKLPGTSATGKGLGDIKAQQAGGGAAGATGGRGKAKKGPHGGSTDAAGNEIASTKTGAIGSTTVKKPTAMTFEQGGAPTGQKLQDQERQAANQDFEQAHPRGGAGTAEGGRFVKKGDSGTLVSNTQTALNQTDKAGLAADGQFGPKTDAAVRDFQHKQGLVVDGVVGIKTSGALRRLLNRSKQRQDIVARRQGAQPVA